MFLFVIPPRFKVEAFDCLSLVRETNDFSSCSCYKMWGFCILAMIQSWGTPPTDEGYWMLGIEMMNSFLLPCIQVLWLDHSAAYSGHSLVLIRSLTTACPFCTRHSPMLSGSWVLFDKQVNIKSKNSFREM